MVTKGLHLLCRKNATLDSNPQRRLTNVLYYGTMQLGTPGQEITICPDTCSASIWTSADATPPAASGNSKIAPAYNGFVSNASSSYQVGSHHALSRRQLSAQLQRRCICRMACLQVITPQMSHQRFPRLWRL